MLKRLKSVSMLLFLMGASTGSAYAVAIRYIAARVVLKELRKCNYLIFNKLKKSQLC